MTRLATGIRRLDELLQGGLPERSSTLVFSPPFMGREVLMRQFILSSVAQKIPAVVVLTDLPAAELRKQLAADDPKYAAYEKAGMVRFVDTYSRSVGVADAGPNIEYVDGLLNFNAVSLAINNAQREFIRNYPQHAFVFDSISTVIAYTNAATAFRYLQVLLGKMKAAGGTGILTLSQGMHADAEVQMVKHLVDGQIELRNENNKPVLRVEGVGVTDSRGWVEYRITERALEITGSFAAGRIR